MLNSITIGAMVPSITEVNVELALVIRRGRRVWRRPTSARIAFPAARGPQHTFSSRFRFVTIDRLVRAWVVLDHSPPAVVRRTWAGELGEN